VEGSHRKDSANPAVTCDAMQANDLARFQTTYGTRPNAFGKCVARQAKQEGLAPVVAALLNRGAAARLTALTNETHLRARAFI
jgi:hypothetical protein